MLLYRLLRVIFTWKNQMLDPLRIDGNHLTKTRHSPVPKASFIVSGDTNLYCQYGNYLMYLRCSLHGDLSLISTDCERSPSSRVDICSVPLWSHEMTS